MGRDPAENSGKRRRRKVADADPLVKWTDLNGSNILRLIGAIDDFGGAVRLGTNRAGTAYAIGIYGDGDPYTEYHNGLEGADEWIASIVGDYEE